MDTTHYINVKFAKGFEGVDKGPFLLEMERVARRMLGKPAEVFLDSMRDQNKLRRKLAPSDLV